MNTQRLNLYLLLTFNHDFPDNNYHTILLRVRHSDLNQYTGSNIAKYSISIWQAWISSPNTYLPLCQYLC